jgi:predicted TIM-barrel fold metal-dependent hydrolase
MVGGKAVKVVDIHGHLVIPESEKLLAGSNVKGDYPRAQIMPGDRFDRMNARGIDMQVISINQYWWYTADRDLAAKIVRTHDEGVSAWCKGNSERFVGLTSPSIQHPDLAAEQLDYAVNKLGLKGASVGGNIKGEVPSSEKFDPFWKKAEDLQVPVFMHPTNADDIVEEGRFKGRGDLGNIVGNPFETSLFLSKLIFDGVFDRFPRLKVGVIELGASWLPSWMRYMDAGAAAFVKGEERLKKLTLKPSEFVRRQIRVTPYPHEDAGWIIRNAGEEVCLFSSDFPHVEGGRNPVKRFDESLAGLPARAIERFYCDNFIDLMGAGLAPDLRRPARVAA